MLRTFSVVMALAVALSACNKPQQPPQMTPVAGYIVLREQPVELTAELPGRTDPTAVSEVRPQVTGIIKARLFVESELQCLGQTVDMPGLLRAALAGQARRLVQRNDKIVAPDHGIPDHLGIRVGYARCVRSRGRCIR